MGVRKQREELNNRILEIELDERKLELLASRIYDSKKRAKLMMFVRVLTKEKLNLVRELSKISK